MQQTFPPAPKMRMFNDLPIPLSRRRSATVRKFDTFGAQFRLPLLRTNCDPICDAIARRSMPSKPRRDRLAISCRRAADFRMIHLRRIRRLFFRGRVVHHACRGMFADVTLVLRVLGRHCPVHHGGGRVLSPALPVLCVCRLVWRNLFRIIRTGIARRRVTGVVRSTDASAFDAGRRSCAVSDC